MRIFIIMVPLLVLVGCGKKDEDSKKVNPVVKTGIVETLSPSQISNVCGQGSRAMSIVGAWKLAAREVEGVFPELLVDFDFHEDGKVEIGLACKVSQDEIRATYNHKMNRTNYYIEGNMIVFEHHDPIVLTVKEDGVNCRLNDLAGTYKINIQGSCLAINLTGQTIYMVRD